MAESDIATIINLIAAVAGLSGIVGLFWGIYQYRESRITKIKDTLFQLVREFDRSEQMYLAKKILDGYVYNFPESINLGLNYFSRENLKRILEYHQELRVQMERTASKEYQQIKFPHIKHDSEATMILFSASLIVLTWVTCILPQLEESH